MPSLGHNTFNMYQNMYPACVPTCSRWRHWRTYTVSDMWRVGRRAGGRRQRSRTWRRYTSPGLHDYSRYPPGDRAENLSINSLSNSLFVAVFFLIYMSGFQAIVSDWWPMYLLWNCPQVNVTGPHQKKVNIGSGNGLVPSGNKPLPEPMVPQIAVTIWRH